ncbi:hypothetical protein EVAR_76473_1 [Eumeta japonica]|uniref:Uncharacterized protein n=1 Tax=Eumeta variegata TaxID=151549 RepID=A0A4C1T5G6_EUMVA|nr:hypothetical protein EVAR_76473_1 [Eumeta japonica]
MEELQPKAAHGPGAGRGRRSCYPVILVRVTIAVTTFKINGPVFAIRASPPHPGPSASRGNSIIFNECTPESISSPSKVECQPLIVESSFLVSTYYRELNADHELLRNHLRGAEQRFSQIRVSSFTDENGTRTCPLPKALASRNARLGDAMKY